jgi:hypothetical protein
MNIVRFIDRYLGLAAAALCGWNISDAISQSGSDRTWSIVTASWLAYVVVERLIGRER